MNDSEQPNPQDVGSQHSPTTEAKENAAPKQPATEQQLKKTEERIEERMSAFERSTIRLTRAAVAVAILTAAFIAFQAYEMYVGGADTSTIADASKRNATAAEGFAKSADGINVKLDTAIGKLNDQAGATHDLAIVAGTQAAQATIQAQEAVVAAKAAQSAADTARDALTRGSRAWVGPDGMLTLTQPVRTETTPVSSQGLIAVEKYFAEKYEARNFGRDPALDVSSYLAIVDPVPNDPEVLREKISAEQDTVCKMADKDAVSGPLRGVVIFPDATTEFESLSTISIRFVASTGFNESQELDRDGRLMIVGCISYRDTFQSLYHTRICFISTDPISKLSIGSKLRPCHGDQEAD